MAFYKKSTKKEDIEQSGGKYINKSGVYPVNIVAPFVSVSKGGSIIIDMYVEHKGQKQVIYGNLRIKNNNGDDNDIGMKVFNQLLIIADLEDVAEPVEHELPIGKAEAMKTVAILEDLADLDVIMRVQMEYGIWNGSITEKKIIKGFYRAEDNASAEEIVNDKNIGVTFENDQKYINNITYSDSKKGANDAPTPEQVSEWISAKRPKGTAGGGTGKTVKVEAKEGFKKKRFGQ